MYTVLSMNKRSLIDAISQRTGQSKVATEAALEAFVEVVQEALLQGDDVVLHGFGTLETSVRKARGGHNPHTGQAVLLPELRLARFRAGKEFKARLNQK